MQNFDHYHCAYIIALVPTTTRSDNTTNSTGSSASPESMWLEPVWREWSQFTDCSQTCGGGVRRRQRFCMTEYSGYSRCLGDSIEVEACNEECCPSKIFFRKVMLPNIHGEYPTSITIVTMYCNLCVYVYLNVQYMHIPFVFPS